MREALEAYLSNKMPGASEVEVTGLVRIAGGNSRETFSFDASWRERGEGKTQGYILRRDPTASLLESDRTLEFHVYRALHGTAVPVPKPFWLETDYQWLERPFMVMERLPGTASRAAMFEGGGSQLRRKLGQQFVAIAASIARIDWQEKGLAQVMGWPGVDSAGGTPAAQQLAHWESIYYEQRLQPYPILKEALLWLHRNKPSANRVSIVHGDFRSGNFLFDGDRIVAMLDWEMAHLGDPMEDLGWACVERWSDSGLVCGLLEREDFLSLYEESSGTEVDRDAVLFYEVLGNVKLAAIYITGVRSFCDGRTKVIHSHHGFLVPIFNDITKLLKL